jgi:hypothetical protein
LLKVTAGKLGYEFRERPVKSMTMLASVSHPGPQLSIRPGLCMLVKPIIS